MIAQTKNNWKRNAVLFLISQCITLFGSMIVQMSIIWYVTLKTSSGAWVAAFTVCSYLPQFLISFLGGVWADRYSHKKLIIFSDTVIMLATFIMFLVIPMMSSDVILLSGLYSISKCSHKKWNDNKRHMDEALQRRRYATLSLCG